MAGSFERLFYDDDTYKHALQEDEKRVNYLVAAPRSCDGCRPPEPGMLGAMGVSTFPDRSLTDVESELKQIGRANSKCPAKDYTPFCPDMRLTNGGDGLPCGGGVTRGPEANLPRMVPVKECSFGQVESRTIMPPCQLRCSGWDRWDPVCLNPQDLAAIEFPGETNVSYRMVVKDNFRACLPVPIDQTAALPLGGDIPCTKLAGAACAAYTGDLAPDRYTQLYPAGYRP